MGSDTGTLQDLQTGEYDRHSAEDRILQILKVRGPMTLDQLGELVTPGGWAPSFLAIDRLSRSGHIELRRTKYGDYTMSLRPRREYTPHENHHRAHRPAWRGPTATCYDQAFSGTAG